jgi:hypothetical protein
VELHAGEEAIGLTRCQRVVVVDEHGVVKVRDARGGCCELAKDVSNTSKSGAAVVRTSDRAVWELGRMLPHARVVWHGRGKAVVMEDKHTLTVVTLE